MLGASISKNQRGIKMERYSDSDYGRGFLGTDKIEEKRFKKFQLVMVILGLLIGAGFYLGMTYEREGWDEEWKKFSQVKNAEAGFLTISPIVREDSISKDKIEPVKSIEINRKAQESILITKWEWTPVWWDDATLTMYTRFDGTGEDDTHSDGKKVIDGAPSCAVGYNWREYRETWIDPRTGKRDYKYRFFVEKISSYSKDSEGNFIYHEHNLLTPKDNMPKTKKLTHGAKRQFKLHYLWEWIDSTGSSDKDIVTFHPMNWIDVMYYDHEGQVGMSNRARTKSGNLWPPDEKGKNGKSGKVGLMELRQITYRVDTRNGTAIRLGRAK
jgi:hypothetical protein